MGLNVNRTISELFSAVSMALDIDEGVKLYHAWRVSIFGAEIAGRLLPEERQNIFYGCLLHDIGAIGLPDHIIHYLLKEEIPQEPAVLAHPLIGAEIISQIPNLEMMAKFILNHHEWHNGKGYPLGRQKEAIPQASQIISIADQIDIFMRKEAMPSQTGHPAVGGAIGKATDLISDLDARRNRQFSSGLIDCAIEVLRNAPLFEEVREQNNLVRLFHKTREDVGEISMPAGVDAIGIACEVFSQLIDTKHPYTIGHSNRVSRYCLLIALAMDLPHDQITNIKWSGLLHDIGKLGISRKLLDKQAGLTSEEYEQIKQHIVYTREILGAITDFKEIARIAGSEHERYDGKGYPEGLKAQAIPLGARIIAVADAFDAMTSDRPYRKAVSVSAACQEIEKNAGTQFDPAVSKEALSILRNLIVTV